MDEEQNGFRVDRRAVDNVFVVNEIIERKKNDGDKLYLGFLDLGKAYDSKPEKCHHYQPSNG